MNTGIFTLILNPITTEYYVDVFQDCYISTLYYLYLCNLTFFYSGKKSEDVFGDLLGSQGYSFTSKKDFGPKTINEMRREDQVKVIDPDRLKVILL